MKVALAISCNAVDEAPQLWSAAAVGCQSREMLTPRLVVGRFADLGLHLGVVHDGCSRVSSVASWRDGCSRRTILSLAEAGFEVIQRDIAHLVFQAVEIHGVERRMQRKEVKLVAVLTWRGCGRARRPGAKLNPGSARHSRVPVTSNVDALVWKLEHKLLRETCPKISVSSRSPSIPITYARSCAVLFEIANCTIAISFVCVVLHRHPAAPTLPDLATAATLDSAVQHPSVYLNHLAGKRANPVSHRHHHHPTKLQSPTTFA